MNRKRYKLIFSRTLNMPIVVSERCKNAGNQAKSLVDTSVCLRWSNALARYVGVLSFAYLSVYSAYGAPAVDALPQGAEVTQGAAAIQQSQNVMNITQSTDKAIINWQSFDIGSAASVNILQPNASSVLLNRVVGNNPSQIFGSLTANGEIILINPNGILFGRDGSVNASAFTASTLDMKDSDFMSGNYRYFRVGGNGEIINQGAINTRSYVALLGAKVNNDGLIATQGGNVMMGAAETIALPVTNSGRIRMELTPASINAAIENTQQGVIVTQGGQVLVQASAINDAIASVVQAGVIDTKGQQGGDLTVLADGNIRVSGSLNAGSLESNRMGGRIIVGRDEVTGRLAKSTNVSGASFITNQGFVETSGALLKTTGVNVQAADWLIDPYNITITSSIAGTAYSDPSLGGLYTYTPNATSTILASDIQNSLNNGTSVKISTGLAGSPGSDAGNITVASNIAKTSGGAATLTLEANNNITINSGVRITDSGMATRNLGVKLTANSASGTSASNALSMLANAAIDVGGSVNIDVAKSVGGGLEGSAIYLTLGTLNAAESNGGSRTLIRGSTVNISMALSGTNTFGLFGQHATGIEATNGDLSITATYSSGSTSGNAVWMGSSWNGSSAPASSILKSTNGGVNVQSIVTGTSADGGLVFSGTTVSATNTIQLKAQITDSNKTAIIVDREFNNPKIQSSTGDILIQSNNGRIYISSLTDGAISGKNVTIDNTGSNLTRDTNGNFTKGSGTFTATSGAAVNIQGSGTGLQATGTLDIIGVSNASGSSGVVQTGTNISGSRVSIQGENLGTGSGSTNGFYNTGTITSTVTDVYIRGASKKDNAVSLQGAITGKTDVNITAQAGDASNTASSWGLYLNKAVTAQSGNVNVTATTTNGSFFSANLASGASLVTSTSGKAITVNADTLQIDTSATPASINAGSSGTVNILPVSSGVAIDLGGSDVMTSGANVLGLSNAELGRVTAGQLNIGNASSGNITVSSAVTTADATGNLGLITGGNLGINAALQIGTTGTKNLYLNLTGSGNATGTASLKANNLALLGTNASYTLNNASNNVGTLAANVKSLSYNNANSLSIGTVNSTSGINTSGDISITATSTSGTALTINQGITASNGNVSLTATTSDTGTTKAAVYSTATVSANHITLNATANGTTGKTLGYYGGGANAKLIATNGHLNLTGSSANAGDGFYMYGGALEATAGSVTVSGSSSSYEGIRFDSAGTNGNVSIIAGNGIVMAGNLTGASVNASNTNSIHLNGVNMTNSAGAVILTATKGSINATLDGFITQNSNGDITLTTVGDGNITVPKIVNNGTGNVIVAAGSDLLAGTGTGGQVLTLSGNTITNSSGKTYIYSGSASGTGLLTNLDNSFGTLSLSGDTGTSLQPILQNADSSVQYMTGGNRNSILNGAHAQILFREKVSVDLSNSAISGTTLTKIYGSANTTSIDAAALLGEMRAQLKQANAGTIVTTSNGNSFTISKSKVIDDLSGSLQGTQYSTSGHLNSNLYSYGILAGTKYTTTLAAGQAQINISKATASVSGTATQVIYNGLTQNQISATRNGFVNGDRINVTGEASGRNAGIYASALSVGGADAANYNISVTNADLTIDKKAVTLTAGSVSKTYDAGLTYSTTQADLNALSNQLLLGDTVTAASIAYTDKNYGIGNKGVTLNSVTLSDGNNGNNYLLTLAGNSTSTINRATLTVSVAGAVEKVYDGTNLLSGLSLMTSGVISGDDVMAIGSGNFNGINVSPSVGFTVSSFAMSGADSDNYSLSTNSLTGTGQITPKTLTVVGAAAQSKVFDGNTNVVYTPGTLNGVINGESITLSSSAAFADPAVGNNKNVLVNYSITDGTNGLASNYTFAGNTSVTNQLLTLYASIIEKAIVVNEEKGEKPLINPVNSPKPAQPLFADAKTHISISSNSPTSVSTPSSSTASVSSNSGASTSTTSAQVVKVNVAQQTHQVNSVIDCVQTSMTGVTLCFSSAD